MYFKIENKNSWVYGMLHALRTKELSYEKQNKESVEKSVVYPFTKFGGYPGQQNARRVTLYLEFKFTNPEEVSMKTWQPSGNAGFFRPRLVTKKGRVMSNFLHNGLKYSDYREIYRILDIKRPDVFVYPFMEIAANGSIYLYLKHELPKDVNIIEITSKEFEEALNEEAE